MTGRRTQIRRYDAKREERIVETILRDAHSRAEQEAVWYRYLKAHLSFPFVATYQGQGGVKPFCAGAKVHVIGFAQPEHCKHTIQVRVMDGQGSIPVPLTQLATSEDDPNVNVISDWRYW